MAQGYPVLDIANLMQAINTLYATYDQITATIEQVHNTYQQLQKQI
jgi:conjugal transfer/entry exclusion protein